MRTTSIVESSMYIADWRSQNDSTAYLKTAAAVIEHAIKALPNFPNIRITASNILDGHRNPKGEKVTFIITHEASA